MRTLTIPRPETLKDLVYRRIRELLLAGRLPAHEIHSANQLADKLGVSRTPVREALLQLSAEGFLEPLKGRGYRMRQFGAREIGELFEARQLIEGHVVQKVAQRAGGDASRLAPLEQAMAAMKKAEAKVDEGAFLEADEAFHRALLAQQENRQLASLLENLRACVVLLGHAALTREGRMREVRAEHERILDALRKGDAAAAARAMQAHLAATEAQVRSAHGMQGKESADAREQRTA